LEEEIKTHYAGVGYPIQNSVQFGQNIKKLNIENENKSLDQLSIVDPFERKSIFSVLGLIHDEKIENRPSIIELRARESLAKLEMVKKMESGMI